MNERLEPRGEITIGSLFSGIGGLELGLERAGFGPVRWQVEIDPFRRSVLARHWPHAERFDDVRSVGTSNLAPVDLICGGFPCKDVSSAGKRAGLTGPQSGLWYEFARIIEEMRPRWVVVENVSSGAKAWVDHVRGDLERLGYASLPVPIAASDCGALHRRARVFIVAHADRESQPALALDAEVACPSAPSHADGRGIWLESRRWGGQDRRNPEEPSRPAPSDPDSDRVREESGAAQHEERETPARGARPSWEEGGLFTMPDLVRVVHGIPRKLDGARRRALGDSVVPQQAEVVGYVIRQLIEAV